MTDRTEGRGTVEAECRWRRCGERIPATESTREAADRLMDHGRQAHGEPYVGANWTFTRPARQDRATRTEGRSR